MDEKRYRRLVLSAYACRPNEGGEAGVGWYALRLALEVSDRCWVATHWPNVVLVEECLSNVEQDRITFVPIGAPLWVQNVCRRIPFASQAYYIWWQFSAGRRLAALHRSVKFDVGHHATFGPDWAPSSLSYVRGLRWAWGPVGGSSHTPLRLWRYLGFKGSAFEVFRRVAVWSGHQLFGNVAAQRASLVLAQNRDVVRQFDRFGKVSLQPSPAISVGDVVRCREPLLGTYLAIGRLLPWKGWALAIEALAHLDDDSVLVFYGVGPDERRLRRIAQKQGIEGRVRFEGLLPRNELLQRMAEATAIVFPSFHDSAPWTVAEALTIGTPVVGLDLDGVRTLLEASGGVPVPWRSKNLASMMACRMREPTGAESGESWSVEQFLARFGKELKEM